MNKRKVLILNGVDSLGLEISKLYLKNNFIVFFQYQKINIDIKKIKKKFGKNFILIKFSFLNTEKKINKFLNLKQIKDCDILINTIDHLKSKNYKSLNFSDITKSLKVNFYPSFYLIFPQPSLNTVNKLITCHIFYQSIYLNFFLMSIIHGQKITF